MFSSMKGQLQSLYMRAQLEDWPASVFVDLTMPVIEQALQELQRENERLSRVVAAQAVLINPMAEV